MPIKYQRNIDFTFLKCLFLISQVHYEDRIGENYFVKHSDGHKWYYYPEMRPEEALIMMQWDSDGELAGSLDGKGKPGQSTFSFHSAFELPNTPPAAPQRESIETRCVAFF